MSHSRFLYIHLPFCDVICHYCDFYKERSAKADHSKLSMALLSHLAILDQSLDRNLEAIYFGGGTPSATPFVDLEKLFARLQSKITPNTEITFEANPTHITAENLQAWKAMGVNRISLGVQSLNDAVLKKLGRTHNGEQALKSIELCRKFFDNVTSDLIYAVPSQDVDEPAKHATIFAEMQLNHVSCYHLTLQPSHFLYPNLPTDEVARNQLKGIADSLEKYGLEQYEIASFAKPGFESRNNQNYLVGGSYAALGPSASGFDGQLSRWKNISDWNKYSEALASGLSPWEETETLTREQRSVEVIFTSLRTRKGLDLGLLQEQFDLDLLTTHGDLIKKWESAGLSYLRNGHLILTFDGRMIADELVKRLI